MRTKNPWGRGPDEPEQPITDLTKNPHARQRDRIAARHVSDAATAADIRKIEAETQRRYDAAHRRATTGALMDPALAEANDKYDADRKARKHSTAAPSPELDPYIAEKLKALVLLWKTETRDGQNLYTIYEDSPLTKMSLGNATQFLLKSGHALNLQMIQSAYNFCVKENHLELKGRRDDDGCIVRKRGEAAQTPPTLFPAVAWADDIAADEAERIQKAIKAANAEAESAKALPLDELQKQVRAKFKISKD
jgi:hypothetical protein